NRPATAQEVIATLDAVSTPRAGTPAPPRRRRRALVGALSAILLVGLAGALAAGARHFMHAAPAAPADDSLRLKVMIADTKFDGGDSTLANNFAETVISDLAKDPWMMALSPEDVRQWASLEGLPPKSLTRDTLVFLAKRGRVSAYLTLGISRAGAGYLLTAAPTGARDGNQLSPVTVAATGAADMPAAMHKVAAELHDELFAQRAELPFSVMLFTIAPVSPRAVEHYQAGAAAADRNDWTAAAREFQAAVREDSTFGMAWGALASVLGNEGLAGSRLMIAVSHAYRLRFANRSRPTQLGMAADYWLTVGQSDRAVATFDSLLALLPNPERVGLNNEALAFADLRRYDDAIETYRKLLDTTYHFPGELRETRMTRQNIVWPLLATGKVAQARAEAAELHRGHRADGYSQSADFMVFSGTRAWAALDSLCRGMLLDTTRSTQLEALQFLAASLSAQGRLAASDSAVQRRARVLGQDAPSAFVTDQMIRAEIAARILGDSARARAVIDSALRAVNWAHVDPLDRPYADVITAFAAAGALDSARTYASEWARVRTPEFRMVDSLAVVTARGELALASGDPREALRLFHAADVRGCVVCFYPRYARAYDALRMSDSARVWYEKYATATASDEVLSDELELARTYRRLGERAEERGDFSHALADYQSFVDLWRKADAPLQPAVADVKARIARLRARGG
ncbi:MAG TPA: hypothetical protein VHB25_07155, partial [Gemmatimonadaceae bacterium]|nr:hypothetical protein [Gemmatimonadaceae bacterium]